MQHFLALVICLAGAVALIAIAQVLSRRREIKAGRLRKSQRRRTPNGLPDGADDAFPGHPDPVGAAMAAGFAAAGGAFGGAGAAGDWGADDADGGDGE